MDMYVNASALNAFSSGMQATAHNIANVSTSNFEPHTYVYMSGPMDHGVVFMPKAGFEQSVERPAYTEPAPGYFTDIINNSVDIPREMVNMIMNQHAYGANARVISAGEDISGVLLDLVV